MLARSTVVSVRHTTFIVCLLTSIGLSVPLGTGVHAQSTAVTRTQAGVVIDELPPPGATLPSDAECAARVGHINWEPRDSAHHDNTTQNHDNEWAAGYRMPDPLEGYGSRVTGNFTGSTADIIRWAACKWGFPENTVFAQAVGESWWNQDALGDCNLPSVPRTHGCQSVGLLQDRTAQTPETYPGLWSHLYNSTALNIDYAMAYRRACFEGRETWLGSGYHAGDLWGCIGRWFSGRWYDSGAQSYIAKIQGYENQQTWVQWGYPGDNAATFGGSQPTATPVAGHPTATRAPSTPTRVASTPTRAPTSVPTVGTKPTSTPTPHASGATVSIQSITVSPRILTRGKSASVKVTLRSTTTLSSLHLDDELYHVSGSTYTKLMQYVRNGVTLKAGVAQTLSYTYTVPSSLPSGTYALGIGVFNSGWTHDYAWNMTTRLTVQ